MNEYLVQPCDLTADQRRRKIAAILAAGVLRLRARAAALATPAPATVLENQRISV
jgi:hypothetical protein